MYIVGIFILILDNYEYTHLILSRVSWYIVKLDIGQLIPRHAVVSVRSFFIDYNFKFILFYFYENTLYFTVKT